MLGAMNHATTFDPRPRRPRRGGRVRSGALLFLGVLGALGALGAIALIVPACGGPAATGQEPAEPVPDAASGPAELVFVGADVMTMNPAQPVASAVAVRAGVIAYVGDEVGARTFVGPETRVVTLAGETLTPGLVDGHAHLYNLGVAMEGVDLTGIASEAQAVEKVKAAAAALPAGEWLTGRAWDQNLWTPARFPTRASLDAAVPDHPVALTRVDGHALWVNSRALALAGVGPDTADPDGGRIVRDDSGQPTGVLIDAAMGLISSAQPPASAETRARQIRKAAAAAIATGLTAIHEMGIDDATLAVYQDLADRGELPLRIYGYLSYSSALIDSLSERPRIDHPSGHLTVRAIKAYADGALGSRGAALIEPYSDDPENRGLVITDAAALARAARVAAQNGWQLGVHAIGDRANRAVLDAFEAAIADHPDADLRFRVEHAQVVAEADLPRFGALGVLASMQPTHATSDMPWAEARVGPERIRGAYAWRTILNTGGRIVGGSDFPVERVAPRYGLYAAVTRQDADGEPPGGWYPEQRLSLQEAVRVFTADAAYAAFSERRRGQIAPGFDADLTLFGAALEPDASLLEVEARMTVVGGEIVYESE